MRILQIVSCRGWSSDAYWAACVSRELARRGHDVTLACRAGTDARVVSRAREQGVERVVSLALRSGLAPGADARDLRCLLAWLPGIDVVHVHRAKEHWLAALANRLSRTPRPLVRTRHIARAVRPHRANRWLYRRATALVVTVTEAIRRQYLAAELLPAERVVALPGGVDAAALGPQAADPALRAWLGAGPTEVVVGMVGGLRAMKGHGVVVEAAARLAARGVRPRVVFIGRGPLEAPLRAAIHHAGLDGQVAVTGFAEDLPRVLAALDVALYVPLESDGMSRVLFEYLAAGRPVIAARVGVVPEILADGQHALLVHAGDADDLARALERLLADAPLRRRLGEAGRRLVLERYSGEQLAAALEERYRRLAA